jgi:hypothetical protein
VTEGKIPKKMLINNKRKFYILENKTAIPVCFLQILLERNLRSCREGSPRNDSVPRNPCRFEVFLESPSINMAPHQKRCQAKEPLDLGMAVIGIEFGSSMGGKFRVVPRCIVRDTESITDVQ